MLLLGRLFSPIALLFTKKAIAILTRSRSPKRNRVSVVNITVNFCRQKRNPVSESLVFDSRKKPGFCCGYHS